jgi:hypothetical protein
MDNADRRKHERKDTQNLIHYTLLGEDGSALTRNMGRTLDVSEEGLLLETHIALDKGQNVLLTVALDEDIVDIKGKIVHSKKSGPAEENTFNSGIEFTNIGPEEKAVLKRYIAAIKYGDD